MELVQYESRYSEHVREIFFRTSSRQTFANPEQREAFFQRWTSYYTTHESHLIRLALSDDGEVLGYLMGCADSQSAAPQILGAGLASYALFADLFPRFPAHLHINIAPQAQGQGLGRSLIEDFAARLERPGVHIITSPEQSNVAFYRKLGFSHEVERAWKNAPLLFMSRSTR